jgi:hypothetical protein
LELILSLHHDCVCIARDGGDCEIVA